MNLAERLSRLSSPPKEDLEKQSASRRKPSSDKTVPATPPDDLEALFSELDRIKQQVSLRRYERPKTDVYLEEREHRSIVHQKALQQLIRVLATSTEISDLVGEPIPREQKYARLKAIAREEIPSILARLHARMTEREKKELLQDFADEVLGLGPIEQLMRDKTISEVMINGPDFVFAERNGRIELTPLRFFDEEHLRNTIAKILAPTGRRVDELSPYVDARLPDGSRVNVAVPPIAVDGSLVTIRKFPDVLLSMEDLLDKNSLVEKMAVFLECAVQGRLNIFVSGGTGSGKTTLLNVLASFIPEHERIVVIEDSAELQIHKTHVNVARLEARPPNIEGRGEITIRDLVRNSLRMRPDRIVVGEVRGAEALEMLQAMNTGHDGSLSTGHGNSPEDMVNRLEAMCLTSGLDLTETVIRKMIAGGLDLIVQQSRLKDGTRKIVQIAEVADYVDGVIRLHPIWEYHPKGVDSMGRIFGRFLWTGTIPRCAKKLVDEGVPLPSEIFSN